MEENGRARGRGREGKYSYDEDLDRKPVILRSHARNINIPKLIVFLQLFREAHRQEVHMQAAIM